MTLTKSHRRGANRTVNLMDLPERLCYGNVLRAFDRLEPGQHIVLVDDLRPDWICELLVEARPNRAEIVEIHCEEPQRRFHAVIQKRA